MAWNRCGVLRRSQGNRRRRSTQGPGASRSSSCGLILPDVKGDRTKDKKHRGGEPESKGFFRTGRGNSIGLSGRFAEQSCSGLLHLPAARLFDNQSIT